MSNLTIFATKLQDIQDDIEDPSIKSSQVISPTAGAFFAKVFMDNLGRQVEIWLRPYISRT